MEKEEYIIYKHTNKINGKIYVGQTKEDPLRRWRKDGSGYKECPLFWKAIQKYGWENFEHEIIEEGLTSEEANLEEIYWIDYYQTYNNPDKGYNLTPGGSNYMEKLWQDPSYRERMHESFCRARSESWKNPVFKKNALDKMLKGVDAFWADPEKREQRIANITGDKNPNSKAVINIETGKYFSTMNEAAQWAGLNTSAGICACCKGKQKTSGQHPETKVKLHWKYADSIESDKDILIKTTLNNRKRVMCINTQEIFESMSAAARWANLNDKGGSIKDCCIGRQSTAGFHPITHERLQWSFVEGGDGV